MSNTLYIAKAVISKPCEDSTYLRNIPAVKYLENSDGLAFDSPVTFFVGENGTGKSTLLEAIAIAYGFNPEGGSTKYSFTTKDSHSKLCDHITLHKTKYQKTDGFFLRAESFYNLASYINDIGVSKDYGIDYHHMSHGESFLELIQTRFLGNALYILDEPEAALSPSRIMALMSAMHALCEADSQFIIATHSAILMAYPNAHIYQFSDSGIESVEYKDTENYKLTKGFLDYPERYLRYLF